MAKTQTISKKTANATTPAKAPTLAKPKVEEQSFVFEFVTAVRIGGKRREAGERIELTMTDAEPLLDARAITSELTGEPLPDAEEEVN